MHRSYCVKLLFIFVLCSGRTQRTCAGWDHQSILFPTLVKAQHLSSPITTHTYSPPNVISLQAQHQASCIFGSSASQDLLLSSLALELWWLSGCMGPGWYLLKHCFGSEGAGIANFLMKVNSMFQAMKTLWKSLELKIQTTKSEIKGSLIYIYMYIFKWMLLRQLALITN